MSFNDYSTKPQWIVRAEERYAPLHLKEHGSIKDGVLGALHWTQGEMDWFRRAVRSNPENVLQLLEEAKRRADKFLEDEKIRKDNFFSWGFRSYEFYEFALRTGIHEPLLEEVKALYGPDRENGW